VDDAGRHDGGSESRCAVEWIDKRTVDRVPNMEIHDLAGQKTVTNTEELDQHLRSVRKG
jgi:hypothetical protein